MALKSKVTIYTKNEIMSATTNPVPPTNVSIIVQVFRVVFSSSPTRDFTSQNPESLKWEHTVEPPATAAVTHARYMGESSEMPGMAAMMPAAIVMATVAEPTQIRTSAATRKATSTSGRFADATALPITSQARNTAACNEARRRRLSPAESGL